MLRVGQLAKKTGLTVRTLHHYDAIGLLSASWRSEAGYRLYTSDDVERLTRILSLRSLGLPLDEIGRSVADPEFSLKRCLELRLARLREQINQQRELVSRLESLLARLESQGEAPVDELVRTLEMMTMFEKHYTPEQLEQLKARRELVGEERIKQVQQEWNELFARYREGMEKGADPSSESVQALARKSRSLILEFTGGDPGIEQSLRNMYRQEGGPNILQGHGCDVDNGLWGYMGQANQALESPDS